MFVAAWVLVFVLAVWVLLLRSRLNTAVEDIRYWRSDSEMWRGKVGQLNMLVRALEAERAMRPKEREPGQGEL